MTVDFKSNVTSNNTNTAYISKTADDEKTGKLGLNDGNSAAIDSTQVFINQVADTNGETEGDTNRKVYSSNNFISDGDDRKVVGGKLDTQLKTTDDNLNDFIATKDQANGLCPLDGAGKVPSSNLPTNMMEFEGSWDASTNTPTLANTDTEVKGTTYRVDIGGTVDFGAGNVVFAGNDWVYNDGTVWRQSDEQTISDTDDVPEGSNLYYTEARVSANTDVNANSAHRISVLNPHGVTKTQVSLGNVTDDAQLKRAAGDIASFTEKVTPIGTDFVLIEDSADSNNKKKVQIANLPSSGGSIETATIEDVKATGVAGGSSVALGVVTRDLNTLAGGAGWAAVAANQFTLQAGTYLIKWSSPAAFCNYHQTHLYDITGAAIVKEGTSQYNQATAYYHTSRSEGEYTVTLGSANTYEIRHYTSVLRAIDGLGPDTASQTGNPLTQNIFTTINIIKV